MAATEAEINPEDCQLIADLQQASAGLLWLSEADFPWEVIYWQHLSELTPKILLQQINYDCTSKVETKELAQVFAVATAEQDWHNEAEKQEVERYQSLVNLLHHYLDNIQVYRVGEKEIELYVLGQTKHQAIGCATAQKAIAGLKTKIIET